MIVREKVIVTKLPDQGIDFLGLNVIHFLHSSFDLLLVSTNVNNENQSVVVLNLLHSRFCSQWILENLIMVQFVSWWGTDSWILRVPICLQSSWTMECNFCSDLLSFLFEGWTCFHSLRCLQSLSFSIAFLCSISWNKKFKQFELIQ